MTDAQASTVGDARAFGTDATLGQPERRAALRRAALLDTPAEPAFDRLTRLAATVLGVPVSLVSLVDVDRQFFKSAHGLPDPWATARETPLTHSFCQYVVSAEAPLVVTDARLHPVLRDNAAVDDIGVIAYAGVPVRSSDGHVIGSLCAIDHEPHAWTDAELAVLTDLANVAHAELALRAALQEADVALQVAGQAAAERTAVVESSLDGVYTVDGDGRCTFANAAALAVLGYPREALLGANMHALVHHSLADGSPFPEAECRLFRALRGGDPVVAYDTTLWRQDGTPFPAECTSAPLVVAGRLAGAVVTFRDVSARVAAAEALWASERKFRAVFEDAAVGIVITDTAGRLLDCNTAYERITGRARDELRDAPFDMVTHPDDVAEQRRLGEALVGGELPQFRLDKRYVRPDASIVHARLTVSLVRDAREDPAFIVAVVEDVTAQRRSESALRILTDSALVLSSSLDYEETLRQVARLALPALGDACVIEVARADGTVDTLCVHVDAAREAALCDRQRAAAHTADAVTVDAVGPLEPDRDELQALGAHHAVRVPLRGRARPLGRVTFGSQRRRYDEADAQLASELATRMAATIDNALLYRAAQAATRARDEVLAVVSHDLRNPVHTIGMSASFLLELAPPEGETARTQLDVIRRSAARADRLIRDLLDVTRIEHGQLRLDRQPAAAADLLAEAVQMVAGVAEQRQIALVVTPSPHLLVDVDRHRILQALDNLLGNALKFTPAGGTVTLGVQADAASDAADAAGPVAFVVRDTGPGVSPAEQRDLFRPFWQARRVDRRGVGLGLSIVKGIVDAHGGTIAVESDGGTGTTIRFTVPRAADG